MKKKKRLQKGSCIVFPFTLSFERSESEVDSGESESTKVRVRRLGEKVASDRHSSGAILSEMDLVRMHPCPWSCPLPISFKPFGRSRSMLELQHLERSGHGSRIISF